MAPIPIPPLPTQRTIADFLDRETARIDQLIQKKERLVELLEEKQKADVRQLVTGHGYPELGHSSLTNKSCFNGKIEFERIQRTASKWACFRIKHFATVYGGGTPSKNTPEFWMDGDVPWVSPKDMKARIIENTFDKITTDAVSQSATSYVPKGAVIMVVRSGILRRTIPVSISGLRLTLNQDLKAFVLSHRVLPLFLLHWIESQCEDLLLEWRQIGATVESIEIPRMMNAWIALPEIEEQKSILKSIDLRFAKYSLLAEKTKASITRLREFRSALITAAVTGQIDVDEWSRRGGTDAKLDAIAQEMEARTG